MIRIGLTGGFGSGKSTVSNILSQHGFSIIDADGIARSIVKPESIILRKLVSTFGNQILSEDGTLDRTQLAEHAFQNKDSLKRLNEIMHPAIYQEIIQESQRLRAQGCSHLILDAPLLIEEDLHRDMDKVIVVWASDEVCLERLMKFRGFSREEATRRIAAQMPLKEKCALADYVIDNNDTLEKTEIQVTDIIDVIRKLPSPSL